jgi:hypothetical protein
LREIDEVPEMLDPQTDRIALECRELFNARSAAQFRG